MILKRDVLAILGRIGVGGAAFGSVVLAVSCSKYEPETGSTDFAFGSHWTLSEPTYSMVPEPIGWPLEVGDTISKIQSFSLAREFPSVAAGLWPEADSGAPKEHGIARLELIYVETDSLVKGDDRDLFACMPWPEGGVTSSAQLDWNEEYGIAGGKTADGAWAMFLPPEQTCDKKKRFSARYVYLGHYS